MPTLSVPVSRAIKELRRLRGAAAKNPRRERVAAYYHVLDCQIGLLHALANDGREEISESVGPPPLDSLLLFKLCDPNFDMGKALAQGVGIPAFQRKQNRLRAEQQFTDTLKQWSSRKHQERAGIDANVGDVMRRSASGQTRFRILQDLLERETKFYKFSKDAPLRELKPDAPFRSHLLFDQQASKCIRARDSLGGSSGKQSKDRFWKRSTSGEAVSRAAMALHELIMTLPDPDVSYVFSIYGAGSIDLHHRNAGSTRARRAKALVACIAAADLTGPKPICEQWRAQRAFDAIWG
jgi:hypothetical protein